MSGPPAPPAVASAAATQARRARAQVKRDMAFSGESLRRVIALCLEPEGANLRRMPVVELLAAMPGVGPRRADEMAERAGIAPGRRLGGLGHLQVETLTRIIDERAARRRSTREAVQP